MHEYLKKLHGFYAEFLFMLSFIQFRDLRGYKTTFNVNDLYIDVHQRKISSKKAFEKWTLKQKRRVLKVMKRMDPGLDLIKLFWI